MLLAIRTPLSFQEVVEAVNKIRDHLAARVELRTSDDGLAHIHHNSFDLLVNATDTQSVRGITSNKSYLLAKEVGAPAIIRLQFSIPASHGLYSTAPTHLEYLLVNRGDDPVLLFMNVLRDLISGQRLQLDDPTTTSMARLLSDAKL